MKTTTFSVTNLTDTDISRLLAECQRELERREHQRTTERKRWVESCYYGFMSHPNAQPAGSQLTSSALQFGLLHQIPVWIPWKSR